MLCVVPFEADEPNLTLKEVSTRMRFVHNIGPVVAPLCNNMEEFREFRKDITASEDSAVQLIVDAGTVRVQVSGAVWESEGFELDNLLSRLSESIQD